MGRPEKPATALGPGREPGTRRVAVSLRDEVVAAIDKRAKANHRSRAGEIEYVIEMLLKEEGQP